MAALFLAARRSRRRKAYGDAMSSASLPADASEVQMSSSRVIFASFIGTAIEFYDFYVYATAAALVIGPVFFPHSSPAAQALSAFVTFGIAFIARPIGSSPRCWSWGYRRP
jgi:hypothetical protein